MVLQEHLAHKAGPHIDLRISDLLQGPAYSWAVPKNMPGPGEKRLAIRQPDHTRKYMDFVGMLPKGYGEGEVKRQYRGPIKIQEASPIKISFEYEGAPYTLINTKDKS